MSARRLRRAVAVAAAALLLLSLPGGTTAHGEEASSELFGYTLATSASAVSLIYDKPSIAIPSAHTFELRAVHSVAELDGGYSGRGFGSVLWPGDVPGNGTPGFALLLLFNPTGIDAITTLLEGDGRKPGLKEQYGGDNFPIPQANRAYPIRAETFYPAGPETQETDLGGGVGMSSAAREQASQGFARTGRGGVPGVLSYGGLESSSLSGVVGGKAVSDARARVADLDLFGGIVHVDQVRTTAVASSDGKAATLDGVTEIVGMTVGPPGQGQRIALDEKGFHAPNAEQDPLGTQAKALLENLRSQFGITISAGAPESGCPAAGDDCPTDRVDGAVASRSKTGLWISLDPVGMRALLQRLPADVQAQLRNPTGGPLSEGPLKPVFDALHELIAPTTAGFVAAPFQFDDRLTFVFGSVNVSSGASPALPPFEPPPPPDFPPPPFTPPFVPGDTGGGFVSPPVGTIGGGGGGGGTVALKPVAVAGVPAGLVGLALAFMLGGARAMRGLADRMTAPRAVDVCPLEER